MSASPVISQAQALPFGKIAASMVRRGVPVTIVAEKDKNPLPFAWQLNATTDPTILMSWIRKYGNQCNCGSVATPDGVWMLDADTPGLIQIIEQETGQTFPKTFTVSSRPGRLHSYFKQSDASRMMGNRALHSTSTYTAPYEFDAQQNRRQVISPGSTHPLGFVYTIVKDVPIVEAPDWLCEWVASKGTKEKSRSTAGKHDLKASPEFEFVDFVEHFDIEVEDDYGSNWYVTPVCPYSGTSHEHSLRTAFYWDGIHLGFHCFAGGCGSPTVGELIRKLNEAHEPFPGEIWPGFTQPDLNDPRWNIDMDEVTVEEVGVSPESAAAVPPVGMTAPPTILSVDELMAILGAEIIPKDQVAAVIAAHKAKVIPISTPASVTKPVEVEDYDYTFGMEDDCSSRIIVDFPRVEPPNDEFLPFPMDAMYGKLGEMTLNLNAPYGFVYPSLLTIACGLDIEDRGGNVRGTLYTALLGGVNFGKSIVTQRAKKSIYTGEGAIEEGTLGSDRGLINDIGEDGLRKVFLQDELRNLLSKCAIQGSSLTPVLCKLWSSNVGAASDKRSKDICNGVVSILGNLAVEDCGDFAKIMGSEITRGLYDRMLFGIGPW